MAGPVGAVVGGVIGAVLGRRAQKGKSILPSLGRSRKTGPASKSATENQRQKSAGQKDRRANPPPAKAKKSASKPASRGKTSAKK